MRALLSCISVLTCCLLFAGMVGFNAPVMPSKDFYINDYAGVIDNENQADMLKAAQELYEKTGVRAVALTVQDFGEHTPEEYAKLIFDSWEIGAADQIGILILLCIEEKNIFIQSNTALSTTYSMEAADKLAKNGSFNNAVSSYFFAVVDSVYSKYPASANTDYDNSESISQSTHETQDTEQTSDIQKAKVAEAKKSSDTGFYAASLVLFLFIMMRGVRISAKYRKKYNNNKNYYRRRIYQERPPRPEVRTDDGDYPSGFGGLGNRGAIYGEDVDAAEDIGIIKREAIENTENKLES